MAKWIQGFFILCDDMIILVKQLLIKKLYSNDIALLANFLTVILPTQTVT